LPFESPAHAASGEVGDELPGRDSNHAARVAGSPHFSQRAGYLDHQFKLASEVFASDNGIMVKLSLEFPVQNPPSFSEQLLGSPNANRFVIRRAPERHVDPRNEGTTVTAP
jgi:hypothetical protein